MVAIGAGRHRKFVRFTDSERCAHFLGVLSLAAQSPRRGYLLIGDGVEAGPEEIANEANVNIRTARSALQKLEQVGILERDERVGAWRIHNWEKVNPDPRDATAADRQRRRRERLKTRDVTRDDAVTSRVTKRDSVTIVTPPEEKKNAITVNGSSFRPDSGGERVTSFGRARGLQQKAQTRRSPTP
jgi:DNA-binding transcriptional regulator YhcF (GntR family)